MSRRCIILFVCIGSLKAQSAVCPKQAPYTVEEVISIARKVELNRAQTVYRACGISFAVDAATEQKLRTAGVPPDLIATLKAIRQARRPAPTDRANSKREKEEVSGTLAPDQPGTPRYVAPESIRVKQHENAQNAYDTAYKKLQAGIATFPLVIDAHQKLVETDIGFSSTRSERITVYANALAVAKKLEALGEQQVQFGVLTPGDLNEVRRHRLEIEIELAKQQSGGAPEELQKDLEQSAQAAFEEVRSKFESGEVSVSDLIRAHDKVIQAQVARGKTHRDWVSVYSKAHENAKAIDRKVEEMIRMGALPQADSQQSKRHLTAVEILLAREQSFSNN